MVEKYAKPHFSSYSQPRTVFTYHHIFWPQISSFELYTTYVSRYLSCITAFSCRMTDIIMLLEFHFRCSLQLHVPVLIPYQCCYISVTSYVIFGDCFHLLKYIITADGIGIDAIWFLPRILLPLITLTGAYLAVIVLNITYMYNGYLGYCLIHLAIYI